MKPGDRKLLFILGELTHSGVEKMLEASAGLWQQAGFQPHILAIGAQAGDYAATLQARGYAIHHIAFSRSPAFIAALLRFHRRHAFQVVHIHTEQAAFWHALVARLAQKHVRLIRSVHAIFAFDGFLRCRRLLQRWIMRSLLQVDFTAPSQSVADHEAAAFANPVAVLPNWLDTRPVDSGELRFAARGELGIAPECFVFASVGNCAEVKNHRGLLQAVALLPLDRPWLYLHVGSSEDEAKEKALAEQLGIATRCLFVGRRPAADMLAAADMFVMPSLHEGFGLAAAEALSMGLHCVLADVAGLRDFSNFSPAITWCDPHAAASIAAAIFAGMQAPQRHLDIAEAVRARFSLTAGVQRFVCLYDGRPAPQR